MLIEKTKDLIEFISTIGTPPYVAVDTEFISEKTYYPQLCLIQIAHGPHTALIDPLSGLDMEPLITFLKNPEIVKVFHAAEQDLMILWNDYKLAPTPIFDTQIAAMVCGFGDQVSFGQLVRTFTKKNLDKSAQIVDWSRRPLLPRHLDYARGDVTHLCPVYEALLADIERRDRGSWIQEEMAELSDPARHAFDVAGQARKLKMRGLSPKKTAIMHELLHWREEQAQKQNLPRSWVVKDLALRDMISNPPKNLEQLGRVRGIGSNAKGRLGTALLGSIQAALNLPKSEYPSLEATPLPVDTNDNALVLLRVLLRHVCDKYGVAPKLLANRGDLDRLSRGEIEGMTSGWRWELFGELAHKLVQGEIALAHAKGEIKIIPQ